MNLQYRPTVTEIHEAFVDQIGSLGGSVISHHQRNEKLFSRCAYALADDVTPGDTINCGVAIRVVDEQVSVHAFSLRKVCTNGAISASSLDCRRFVRAPGDATSYCESRCFQEIEEAIQHCSDPAIFQRQIATMRRSAELAVDKLMAISFLLRDLGDRRIVNQIMDQFLNREPHTAYGLMNAVTSVARGHSDPQIQWDLEEYGCGVGARLLSTPETLNDYVPAMQAKKPLIDANAR